MSDETTWYLPHTVTNLMYRELPPWTRERPLGEAESLARFGTITFAESCIRRCLAFGEHEIDEETNAVRIRPGSESTRSVSAAVWMLLVPMAYHDDAKRCIVEIFPVVSGYPMHSRLLDEMATLMSSWLSANAKTREQADRDFEATWDGEPTP